MYTSHVNKNYLTLPYLTCNDAEIAWNLAVYVFKAVALRKSLL